MSRGSKRAAEGEVLHNERSSSGSSGQTSEISPSNKRARMNQSSSSAHKSVAQAHNERGRDLESTISAEDASEIGPTDDEEEEKETQSSDRNGNAHRMNIDGGPSEEEDDELDDEDDEEEDELEDEKEDADWLLRRGELEGVQSIGAIERVDLTNFMCHKRLVCDLGPKVNFVIGHNGSGKSAILTALTLGLGAKAINTSRGSSIKSFVKEGEEAALIKLTMTNSGIDAYRHELYGDQIIIERTIRADGSGSWKIKSKNGQVVSTKRDELDALCEHANIQADNPINVLTQDASRQFLTSSKSQDKYELFMRGSQLTQLQMEYDQIKRNIAQIEDLLKQKKGGMNDLEKKAKDTNDHLNLLTRAREQRGELETLKQQMIWSQVVEKENVYAKAASKTERHNIQTDKIRSELEASIGAVQRFEKEIKEWEHRATSFENDIAPMHRELDELRQKQKDQQSVIRNLTGDVATIDRQYKGAKAQLEDINDRIHEAEKAAAGDRHGRRLQLSNKRDQLKLECNKIKQEDVDVKDRAREVDAAMQKLEEDRNLASANLNRARENVGSLEMHIRDLRNAKNNHLSAYGPNMPALFQAVQKENRWRGPIVGPIGSLIKIRDPQWAPVLESVIGNTLNAFCVTNVQDRELLLQLMREARCPEIPIITGSNQLFDFSSGEPDGSILTVLRVLDFDDEFIKRQLIVHLSIERAALVPARVDGDVLMRTRPRNVKAAFSKDLFRLSYESGSSTQTLQPYRGPPRLSTNVEERLVEALTRLPQEERKVTAAGQALSRIDAESNQLRQEKGDLRAKLTELQRQLRNKQKEMDEVEEELREDEPTNVTALQAGRQELEEECKKLLDAFTAKEDALEAANDVLEPLVKRKNNIDRQIKGRNEGRDSIRARLTEAAQSRVKAVSGKQHYEKKIQEADNRLEELKGLEEIARRSAEQLTAQAEAICERVEVSKSVEEYRKEVKAMNARINQAARQDSTNIEALMSEVTRIFAMFNKARDEIKAYSRARKMLYGSLELRLTKWHIFRAAIAKQAKVLFSHFLSLRGYQGKLSFDHRDCRLSLMVKTDAALDQRGEKNPRALSGGEKSYSTICLLLALWQAVNCPLRCLDEFDVFMDAVNRRISMQLIMHVAKRTASTQYVFITPQNISNIPNGPHVRIIRLQDPERNQTTLT